MVQNDIKIWHVSNAGVILCIGSFSIGIDILVEDKFDYYMKTPRWLEEKLLDAENTVQLDYLIITHEHSDHYSEKKIKEFLKNQHKVTLIHKEGICRDGKLLIECFNTKHMGEMYADVQNLSIRISYEEIKILFTGDADPRKLLDSYDFLWEEVTMLICPFPYVTLESVRRELDKKKTLKDLFVCHLPAKEEDMNHWNELTDKAKRKEIQIGRNVILGNELGKIYETKQEQESEGG